MHQDRPLLQIVRKSDGELIAEAPSMLAASTARATIAREFRRPATDFQILYPAFYRVPVAGGRTCTALEARLPIIPGSDQTAPGDVRNFPGGY